MAEEATKSESTHHKTHQKQNKTADPTNNTLSNYCCLTTNIQQIKHNNKNIESN